MVTFVPVVFLPFNFVKEMRLSHLKILVLIFFFGNFVFDSVI